MGWKNVFLSAIVGLLAVIFAFWFSTAIVGKAFSQSPPAPSPAPSPVSAITSGVAQAPSATPGPEKSAPGMLSQIGSQVVTVVPQEAKKALPVEAGETKIPELLVGIIEDYSYSAAGKRDPFTPFEQMGNANQAGPVWPLQKYDLEQLKLVGIIWNVKTPKAMIIDPGGHGYVVTVNERIGRNNGYIARIREGEIVVVENVIGNDGKGTYVTKLMKLNPQ